MKNLASNIALSAAFIFASLSVSADPNQWSRYRGPNGTAVSSATNIPTQWSAEKNIAWRTALPGPGLSSPVVWKNHVYVTCFTGFDWPKEHNQKKLVGTFKRHLLCIDLQTGKIKWQKSDTAEHYDRKMDLADGYWQVRGHGFASNTPACDANGVYAYFGPDGLFAYTHEGELRWTQSCGQGHGRTGSAASPILVGDKLIMNAANEGSRFYGINTSDGQIAWQIGRHGEYATPTTRTRNGKTTVLTRSSHGGALKELNPADGKTLWETGARLGPSHTSIMVAGDKIISLNSQAHFTAMDATGKEIWTARGGPYFGTPVYHEGRLYYAGGGVFSCLDVDTGNPLYRERIHSKGYFYAAPVIADGKVYCVSRESGTYVFAATATYKLLAQNKIANDDSCFDGTPAIVHDGLILRSDKYLYRIKETD